MQSRRRADEIPGNNSRKYLNSISNDTILAIKKLELNLTIQNT